MRVGVRTVVSRLTLRRRRVEWTDEERRCSLCFVPTMNTAAIHATVCLIVDHTHRGWAAGRAGRAGAPAAVSSSAYSDMQPSATTSTSHLRSAQQNTFVVPRYRLRDHIRPSSIFCCGPHSVEQSSCRIQRPDNQRCLLPTAFKDSSVRTTASAP